MCFWGWWFHWGEGGSHTPCRPLPLCVLHCCRPVNQSRVRIMAVWWVILSVSWWRYHQNTVWCEHPRPPQKSQPQTRLPNLPSFSSTYFNRLGWCWWVLGSVPPWLRPGLLTYQATLRMWPLYSPVGGALKPPEHRVLVLSVEKVQHSNCWQVSQCFPPPCRTDLWFLTRGLCALCKLTETDLSGDVFVMNLMHLKSNISFCNLFVITWLSHRNFTLGLGGRWAQELRDIRLLNCTKMMNNDIWHSASVKWFEIWL